MGRAEKSAEAVVAESKPARAGKPEKAGSLWRGEGPNGRESGTPASLGGARHQKPRQLGLPLGARGEAPQAQRSGEAPTATDGNGRSGTGRLMEEVVERTNAGAALKRVRQNKGSPGTDGMTVEELPAYLTEHWEELHNDEPSDTH